MTHTLGKLTYRLGFTGALVFALFACVGSSHAQTKYPDKPVRIVLPFGPGGVADVTMRLVAQKLTERLGQNFFIENRPGAGGIVGAKAVLVALRPTATPSFSPATAPRSASRCSRRCPSTS